MQFYCNRKLDILNERKKKRRKKRGSLMNLTTHLFFGLAVGFLFFGQPALALLVAIGALLPDLDREYWFILKPQQYRDEQLHRSLFHNFFVMAIVALISPIVSLGMFLHTLQDALTTVKDRGCEWLYPVTRLVKRGLKNAEGNDESLDPKEHIYFYQEDSKGLLENADPDLGEPGDKPVPWRRTYGPALNGELLDTGFLIGSVFLIILWMFIAGPSRAANLATFLTQKWSNCLIGFGSIGLVFASGELDRRLRPATSRKLLIDVCKVLIFFTGIGIGIYALLNFRSILYVNLMANNWLFILFGTLVITFIGIVIIKVQTRSGKIATV